MADIKALKLNIEASMMSWTIFSPWIHLRVTSEYPTKTALVGLIAAAYGIERNDTEALNNLSDSLCFFVDKKESDVGNLMTDFQTVKRPTDKDYFVTAEGKKKDDVPLIHKQYRENAHYTVYVLSSDKSLEDIAAHLDKPLFPLYFGRKGCIPTARINAGIMTKNWEGDLAECLYLK